jgi:GntR family transcriptional regulator/MocR family aminotransferase
MASQDPSQLVIYVSTFSKIMFPGARIGLMALSKPLAKAVEEYRLLICHKSNVLMQSALAKWMQSGGFERHLRRTTRINQQRRDSAVLTLKKHQLFEFMIPDGGMALWLKVAVFKVDASKLAEYAREVGVYIQHQSQYQSTGEINQDDYIRIGFAGMNEQKFAEGIDLLVQLIRTKFLHN